MKAIIRLDKDKHIYDYGDYVRVYTNCSFRNGWICELQVPSSDWTDTKYDKYRR